MPYRHEGRSSRSLAESVAPDAKLAGVAGLAVDVPVGAVVDRGGVEVSVTHCAREASLVPSLFRSISHNGHK